MYAEYKASAMSDSRNSARLLAKSKTWLTRFISTVSRVVMNASMGSMQSEKRTAFWLRSKYRLILMTASSKAPISNKEINFFYNMASNCKHTIYLPFFSSVIWSSWLNPVIKPGTILANSIICLMMLVNSRAAVCHNSSCDCKCILVKEKEWDLKNGNNRLPYFWNRQACSDQYPFATSRG